MIDPVGDSSGRADTCSRHPVRGFWNQLRSGRVLFHSKIFNGAVTRIFSSLAVATVVIAAAAFIPQPAAAERVCRQETVLDLFARNGALKQRDVKTGGEACTWTRY